MKKRFFQPRFVAAPMLCCLTAVLFTACSPDVPRPGPQPTLVATVDEDPGDSAAQASVMYIRPDSPIPVVDASAVVTVNGAPVVPSFFGYIASLTPVAAGADVTMHFAFESVDLTRTLVMPSKPVVTTPNGTAVVPSNPTSITWDAVSPEPDAMIVSVSLPYTASF